MTFEEWIKGRSIGPLYSVGAGEGWEAALRETAKRECNGCLNGWELFGTEHKIPGTNTVWECTAGGPNQLLAEVADRGWGKGKGRRSS